MVGNHSSLLHSYKTRNITLNKWYKYLIKESKLKLGWLVHSTHMKKTIGALWVCICINYLCVSRSFGPILKSSSLVRLCKSFCLTRIYKINSWGSGIPSRVP